jgi:hypothetical protein
MDENATTSAEERGGIERTTFSAITVVGAAMHMFVLA